MRTLFTNDDINNLIQIADFILKLTGKIQSEVERPGIRLAFAADNPYVEKCFNLERQIEDLTAEVENLKLKKVMPEVSEDEKKERAYFTKKELTNMPKLKECHIRLKSNGTYEIRYRRNGIEKSFASKNLKDVKSKCSKWLKSLNGTINELLLPKNKRNINFVLFADNYMETVKKPNVVNSTYISYYAKYKRYIREVYKDATFNDFSPISLQKDLSELQKKCGRTTEDIKMLLKGIFNYAIANGIIDRNPVDAVFLPPHERTCGTALTLADEARFVRDIVGSPYEGIFLLMLYSGCRPAEVASFVCDKENQTITFKNAKLKRYQKQKTRTLPLFPLLKKCLPKILAAPLNTPYITVSKNFKHFLPNYSLKDLRHTFATRAKECGCNPEVVNIWQGHSAGKDMTAMVYTHYTMNFQKQEAEKLVYDTQSK